MASWCSCCGTSDQLTTSGCGRCTVRTTCSCGVILICSCGKDVKTHHCINTVRVCEHGWLFNQPCPYCPTQT